MTPPNKKKIQKNGTTSSRMMTDDNDEEVSSYSSFYSSFLKTEKSNSTIDMDSAGEPSNSITTFKDKDSSTADDRSCSTNEAKTRRVSLSFSFLLISWEQFSSSCGILTYSYQPPTSVHLLPPTFKVISDIHLKNFTVCKNKMAILSRLISIF